NLSRKLIRKSENRAAVLASLLVEPPPERLPTDRLAEQRELVRRIPAALARLPHELRVVYAMVELEQLSGAEAARVLGIPPGTAWRRLHQARRALLALIAEVP